MRNLLKLSLLMGLVHFVLPSISAAQSGSGLEYIVVPYDEKSTIRRFNRDYEEGNHASTMILALYYLNGIYVDQDVDKAVEMYTKAAEDGYAPAQVVFARHILGRQMPLLNAETSYDWLLKAAAQDFAPAHAMLAEFYRAGIGVGADNVRAIEHLKTAANLPLHDISKKPRKLKDYARYPLNRHPYSYPVGNSDVMNLAGGGLQLVGQMRRDIKRYSSRFRDMFNALEYYDKIDINRTILQSQYNLGAAYQHGRGMDQSYDNALMWYKKAAEQGHHNSILELGWMTENGMGVAQDYEKAMEYYKLGAEYDNPQAIANIGHLYDLGNGVEKNDKEAIKWFEEALELNPSLPTANRSLGLKYLLGQGVKKDEKIGYEMTLKAANRNDLSAMGNIAVLYFNGIYLDKDINNAIAWYEKAAKLGSASSMQRLGAIYQTDEHVTKDLVKSYMWHSMAAERGNETSSNFLPNLEENLSEDQIAEGKRLAQQWLSS